MTLPAVSALLSALVEGRAGLHYREADRAVMLDKVEARASEAGYESLLDYYYFLRYDPEGSAELDRLVDALLVGETYFFREREPLEMMVRRMLAPAVAAGRRARVWSAACATGEEPLGLAMLLAEAGILDRVELVATDINQKALDKARAGHFGRRSLRGYNTEVLARYSTPVGTDQVQVDQRLTEAIRWQRLNLVEGPAVAAMGLFDVILCRNVLIYFSDVTTLAVVDALGRALAPDGALFVGVSESLFRVGTQLVCEERERVFYYRRPR